MIFIATVVFAGGYERWKSAAHFDLSPLLLDLLRQIDQMARRQLALIRIEAFERIVNKPQV